MAFSIIEDMQYPRLE